MPRKNYALKRSLKAALRKNEFVIYYQPQYDAMNKRLISAEALVRWDKKGDRIIMPSEFMTNKDFPEILDEIDWYVLKEVCNFIRNRLLDKKRILPIAVNFTPSHSDVAGFVDELVRIVDHYGVSHRSIVIELTESVIGSYSERLVDLVNSISAQGFPVAIDDFGRGAHSLPLLKEISPDILKIDNSLIKDDCQTAKERAIISSVVDLAHHLGITTIAEGVETENQLNYLRECGCEMVQGFYFSRPLPQDIFEALLETKEVLDIPDILATQSRLSQRQLLIDGINIGFPLVVMVNLSRNTYYMLNRNNYTVRKSPETGKYDELVASGLESMHCDDVEKCRKKFSIGGLLAAYYRGERSVSGLSRQLGDDGEYRLTLTVNVFVKNPCVEDILMISMCRNV